MEMNGSRTVPSDLETTWRALNDPEVLKACIAGCEAVDRVADNEYRVAMTARVGPVSARFTGRIFMTDVVAPVSYTLGFDGQGGAAGFVKGEAHVALSAIDSGTCVDYQARAQVGGKLAQIGSRLVDGAAAKVADDFFARFVERLSASQGAAVPPDEPIPLPAVSPGTADGALSGITMVMWLRLALAVAIIVGMVLYWVTQPA